MRWLTLAVAALLLVGGCNALTGTQPPTRTVTPVSVPDVTPTQRPERGTEGSCLAPPPASPDRTPAATPTSVRPLPTQNGTVTGATLVDIHDAVLPRRSYRLRIDHQRTVWSLAGHAAFAYDGNAKGRDLVDAYAVGGTLYLLEHNASGPDRLSRRPYDPNATPAGDLVPPLTGRNWLEETIGNYEFTLVGNRTWKGTRVRVLRATVDGPERIGFKRVYDLNSTLYVGPRGVIRRVSHVERFAWIFPDETPGSNATRSQATEGSSASRRGLFLVTDVGTARIPRPSGFCGHDGDAVTVSTPTAMP